MPAEDVRRGTGSVLSTDDSSKLPLVFVRLAAALTAAMALAAGTAYLVDRNVAIGLLTANLLLISGLAGWQLLRERPQPVVIVVVGAALVAAVVPYLETPLIAAALLLVLVGFGGSTAMLLGQRHAIYLLLYIGVVTAVSLTASIESEGPWIKAMAVFFLGVGLFGTGALYSKASDDVRKANEQYRDLFESAADAIIGVDAAGRIALFNGQAEALFGYSRNEVIGRSVTLLMPARFQDGHASKMQGFALGSVSRSLVTSPSPIAGVRKDGTEFPIEVTISKRTNGDATDFTAFVRDVTDREMTRHALEESLRFKDKLIASISHELRTPLAAVVGFTQLLQEKDSGLSEQERIEMIDSVAAESMDLADIVEDLLVAARSEAGLLHVSSVSVDLRVEARHVLTTMGPTMASEIEVVGSEAMAMGDPGRVRQILRNLLSNAARYGGLRIQIWTGIDGSTARLTVYNDGSAIPIEDRERIFEAYQSAHKEPGLPNSLGLGLTISRQLARLMGGDLSYRREEGRNVFDLSLPRADGATAQSASDRQATRKVSTESQ